jgi:acyl carrier protein
VTALSTLPDSEIHAGVAELLAQVIEVAPADVPLAARLAADLGVDSLSLLELVIGVEERFGVRIADADVAGLVTIEDAVRLIAAAV